MPTALVTGASRGLGAVYAHELAERGWSVVLVARDAARLADVAERIGRATGAIVEILPADLTDPAGLAAVERRITDRDLPIELLVNNAGVETDAVFAEAPVEALTGEIDLNVTALMRLTRAAVPAMTARGRGGVLNIASFAGYLASGGNAYGASKSWVLAFSDTVAASLHGTGVTVTAVAAGRIRTDDDPQGPLWLDPRDVVRRSLDDLARGRTLSAPGWVYRALVGYLEAPRTALRLAARVAGRGRERCERLERGSGHARPSPVPTPFRDAPAPARPQPAVAVHAVGPATPVPPVLPEEPARPAHVAAATVPAPRVSGTGPLPVVTGPAGTGAAAVRPAAARAAASATARAAVRRLPAAPRPVQPARDAATVRLAAG
ncbi:SDR family NAD(P)-dependent oxidoreductase [Pseudonocardia sp. DR1-2]|uniref:SDR family NAD(P)-dependent oxidoreductase n=1 Tax=Pseudonocardia sp. DR1-2 TaxID=2951168 RepID=UPI002044A4DF|nr:SDR family NAD(P)-dependent oxidoreductase [Pseudonocardia sp. DR1-2]MCM3848038.1 SDR family NAD(P)-dependent oxidoreductase [Pseudonocardia sp. DR1-2]